MKQLLTWPNLFQINLSIRSGVTRPDEVRITTDTHLQSPIQLVNYPIGSLKY